MSSPLFSDTTQVRWFEGETVGARVGHPSNTANTRTAALYYMNAGNGSTPARMNCSAFR
jgi:hypothetical protein